MIYILYLFTVWIFCCMPIKFIKICFVFYLVTRWMFSQTTLKLFKILGYPPSLHLGYSVMFQISVSRCGASLFIFNLNLSFILQDTYLPTYPCFCMLIYFYFLFIHSGKTPYFNLILMWIKVFTVNIKSKIFHCV